MLCVMWCFLYFALSYFETLRVSTIMTDDLLFSLFLQAMFSRSLCSFLRRTFSLLYHWFMSLIILIFWNEIMLCNLTFLEILCLSKWMWCFVISFAYQQLFAEIWEILLFSRFLLHFRFYPLVLSAITVNWLRIICLTGQPSGESSRTNRWRSSNFILT